MSFEYLNFSKKNEQAFQHLVLRLLKLSAFFSNPGEIFDILYANLPNIILSLVKFSYQELADHFKKYNAYLPSWVNEYQNKGSTVFANAFNSV